MPLIVTPGSLTADSYATLAATDAYYLALGGAGWTGATAIKESALRRATAWLDGAYKSRWPGLRTFARNQSLDWPRIGACDRDGNYIDSLTIPLEVEQAAMEAALREIQVPFSLTPDIVMGREKVLTKVDAISWTPIVTGVGADSLKPFLTSIEGILSGVVSGYSSTMLIRA